MPQLRAGGLSSPIKFIGRPTDDPSVRRTDPAWARPSWADAKDFRTWHATVMAAEGLARVRRPRGRLGRRRAVRRVIEEVARRLGNTPAVALGSYVDPRVVPALERGRTVAADGDLEAQVIELVRGTRRGRVDRS